MRKPAIIAMLLVASPAWSGGTGADIYAACISAPGTSDYGNCAAYLNGFVNGVLTDQIASEAGLPVCLPDNTSTQQVRDVVVNYIAAHPGAKTFEFSAVVGFEGRQAFPCKKSN
jgi:hypothetical protein